MLVLSRRVGEKVVIGDGIVVTVISTQGGKMKLGIEAPFHIPVDRAEIRRRKVAELEVCERPQLVS